MISEIEEINNLYTQIGFKLINENKSPAGVIMEYKYYPNYLKDSHYTLVTFNHIHNLDTDYRLYQHENNNNRFIASIFQLNDYSQKNIHKIIKLTKKTFLTEFREDRLNILLQ